MTLPKPASSPFVSKPSPANNDVVPMDLSRTQRPPVPADTCRKCKQQGHWAKDCPLKYDVRFMDADELEQYRVLALDTQEIAEREEEDQGFDETDG